MIDSVLKGTGNSRFLKSAVPAGTSWADALAMLQAGTFPIDFNGINTEGFQQVGTPLNKANLLKDATAAQIGLPPSTTPDGMFQALGNTGELHVWRKTVTNQQAGYDLSDVKTNGTLASGEIGYTHVALSSGSSVLVSSDGYVTIDNPNNQDFYATQSSGWPSLSGKFIKITGYAGDGSGSQSSANSDFQVGTILHIPSGGNIAHNGSGRIYLTKYQIVTGHGAGTTTTYPVSTNPNAYQEGDDAKEAGYVVGEAVSGQFKMSERYPTDGYYYKYASSISVADNGTISLDNPSQISFDSSNGGQSYANSCLAKIAGKFMYLSNRDSGTNAPDSKPPFNSVPSAVVYVPSDATLTWTEGGALDGFTLSKYQPVTGYAAIPAGTTIEYLGKLGDKARVQVISYVGTGTYGSSNPNSLTFDFAPKMVIIRQEDDAYAKFDWIIGITSVEVHWDGSYNCFVAIDGKKLSFYSLNGSLYQMNQTGEKYYAIAIG